MSKKIIIIYFSVIILLSLLFSSLYTQIWDPMWNPFRAKPSVVLAEMGDNLTQVKTYHSVLDFEIGITNKEEFNIKGNIIGDRDNSDFENLKYSTDFDLSFAAEGIEFSLAGQSKNIGETGYFKLTTIPALPFLEPMLIMLGIDLNQFKNQWIKVDEESFKEIIGEECNSLQKEKQKEMLKELTNLLKGESFFRVEEEFPDEEINGKMFYHYLVFLDKETIKKIMPEMFEKIMEYTPEEDETKISEGMTEEFLGEFSKGMDEFFKKTGEIDTEIWLGKKDKLPYRIKIEREIDISEFEEGEQGIVTIKLDINLSEFNQPKEIKAPETFKTLDEILIPFYLPLNEGDTFPISEEMFLE
ncbi:hypothetical protein KAU51_00020 [Candidatus Parcubacteria bacterium]|nr:hypothetical protein [Candidatus Parcubacteria bacterium]